MPELPPGILGSIPWNPEPESIWVATTLHLRRNLARYNFPGKLSKEELEQVRSKLATAFEKQQELSGAKLFAHKEMSPSDRQLVYEHFFFLRGFSDPPDGTGVLLEDKGEFLALINAANHLEMHALIPSSSWQESWNRLTKIEEELGKVEDYAFSPKFGYLTADPSHSGTGLTVNAYLHLPALIHTHQLENALASGEEDEVLFMGLAGDLQELTGDLLVIQNNYSIGMSEEAILHAVQTAATKLLGAEKTMRSHVKEEGNTQIKDQVSKAFGLLVHSFQLDTKEAIDLLSMMKLGLALGYIEKVSEEKLNALLFQCRRGHLTHFFPELSDSTEIEKKRAHYLQTELSGICLSHELSS